MRMAEFYIDGFGRFADLSFADIPPGLTVIRGDNEAGKSTLLAFLRSILFGLPGRNQKDFYPPLEGGRKGGRIILLDDGSERVIVERFEGKGKGPLTVTLPDGSQGGEEEFRQLIGSATPDLYENVFAFSLSELQTFDSLKTDKVRDAIYSAGIGVGRRTITEVVRELDGRQADLFAPRGSNPALNKVLKRIEGLRDQIKAHLSDQDEHDRIRKELESRAAALEQLGLALSRDREQLERVRLLQQARSDWVALGQARQRLADLPEIESFPEDGTGRLDKLVDKRRDLRDQIDDALSRKKQDESSLADIEIDEALLRAADEVNRLDRRLESFEQQERDHPSVARERDLAEQRLGTALRNLGDEWDEGKLRGFDLSVPVREEIDACRDALLAAQKTTAERRLRRDREREQVGEAEGHEQEARARQEQLPRPLQAIDVDAVDHLVMGRERYESARSDLPSVETECRTREERLHDTLRGIGPDWTEERLMGLDTSLAVREQVQAHQKRLTGCEAEDRDASRSEAEAERAVSDAQAQSERAEEVLAAMPKPEATDEAPLTERRRTLRSLLSVLGRTEDRRARLGHLQERKQDLDDQASRLSEELSGPAGLPRWTTPALLVVAAAATLGLGLARGDWLTGCIVGGMIAIVPVLLALGRRNASSRTEAQRSTRAEQARQLEDRCAELEQEIAGLQQELADLEAQIKEQAESLGLGARPVRQAVETAEAEAEQCLWALQRLRPAEQKLGEAKDGLARSEDRLARARESAEESKRQLEQARDTWRAWLAEAGLPETLTADSAISVLGRLEIAREQLKTIEGERERIARMKEALLLYERQVEAAVSSSGLAEEAPQDAGAAVAFLSDRIKACEEQTREADLAGQRVKEAEAETGKAREKAAEAEKDLEAATESERQCEERWRGLLERLGLRPSLAVESAPEMLQAIQTARAQLDSVNELRGREGALEGALDAYRQEARSVAAAAGRQEPTDEEVAKAVSALAEDLKEAEEQRRQAESLKESIGDLARTVEGLENRLSQRGQEVTELLEAGGAVDEEDFRRRAAQRQDRQNLEREIRETETRLQQLVGSEDALAGLGAELEETTPESVAARQQALEEAISAKERERSNLDQEHGGLRTKLEQLERSAELSGLRVEEQAARAELASGAEEWAVLRIAGHLIDRAREEYERDRRPAVLKEAEQYFSRFTQGGYTEILAPVGEDDIFVLAPDGSRKEIGQLSRGTAEQIYLSLRFGFVKEFVRRSEPLPLVFDDILVNFDPGRARAAAEAIMELSQSLQILLFTCHPPTVDVMRAVDRSVNVYELRDDAGQTGFYESM